MGLLRWLTENYAETATPSHSDLAPMRVDVAELGSGEVLKGLIADGKGWAVEAASADDSQLAQRVRPLAKSASWSAHLTHRTGVMRFVDDVWIWIDAGQLQFYSASRIGKGDMGQNRRNILMLQGLLQGLKKSGTSGTDARERR